MLRGVDVSDYQPGIDWPAVVAAGWTFAVIKATEGTGNVQSTFATNRDQAHAAGINPLGIYHFARPENANPEAQADHFANVVLPLRPDEFVVLDIETRSTSTWPDFIARWIARLGLPVPVVVYMSESPAKSMPASCAEHPLWVAGYQRSAPTAWEDWRVGPWSSPVMWQWSSSESVPGIGAVDTNVAPDDLRARLGLTSHPTPVPPTEGDPRMLTFRYIFNGLDFVFDGPSQLYFQCDDTAQITEVLDPLKVPALGTVSPATHKRYSDLAKAAGFAG